MKRKLSTKLIVERMDKKYKRVKINGKVYSQAGVTQCCPIFILKDLGVVLKIDDDMNQVTKAIIRWKEWITKTRLRKYFLPILAEGKVRKGKGDRWLVQEYVKLNFRIKPHKRREIEKVVEHFGLSDVYSSCGYSKNWATLTKEDNRPIIYDWAL